MKTLDCQGLLCPRPVLETRKQLLAKPNESIIILVDNEIAQTNVTRLANKEGFSVEANITGNEIKLLLQPDKNNTEQQTPAPATTAINQNSGDTIVYISSNCMGNGDDKLGEVLMRNFIFTLAETTNIPATILFVNSGVKLTCAGSAVLEPLKHLAAAGTNICSCGLCLEFFKLQDQLAIGDVSNMLETVEAMQEAGRIIQP